MSGKNPDLRHISLTAPRDGAYRVKIVGEDARDVTTLMITGHRSSHKLKLAPGHYTAFIEDVAHAIHTTMPIDVSVAKSRQVIAVEQPDLSAAPLPGKLWRPSREPLHFISSSPNSPRHVHFFSMARDVFREEAIRILDAMPDLAHRALREEPTPRRFAIGLTSLDKRPSSRTGWRPGLLPISRIDDAPPGSLAFAVAQPPDWNDHPKWRLTVAVEGDQAWHLNIPLFSAGLRIDLAAVLTGTRSDLSAQLTPLSPSVAALVGSTKRSAPGQSEALLQWSSGGAGTDEAISVLARKMSDPWAAAAAAILLARSGDLVRVAQWANNLTNWFPWLADAAVTAAWVHAATSEASAEAVERHCLKLLKQARTAALYFCASSGLALDMLGTIATGSRDADIRVRARAERSKWSRWGRRFLKSGAFVSWEQSGKNLRQGMLPRSYGLVASGTIAGESLAVDPGGPIAASRSSAGAADDLM